MSVERSELTDYLNQLLQVGDFHDYGPNGLQIEGKDSISRIVTGVTACQALIEKAIALQADALLVHHGFFWQNEEVCITKAKQRRIKSLLTQDINLFGYHLPLDAHDTYGNNVQLAKQMDWIINQPLTIIDGHPMGLVGQLETKITLDSFAKSIEQKLKRTPLVIDGNHKDIQTIAWCTGGAQDMINLAIEHEVDCFISGEISERTTHIARENQIHYIAAGHHATERYGVQALGEHINQQFEGVECLFVDIDNPV